MGPLQIWWIPPILIETGETCFLLPSSSLRVISSFFLAQREGGGDVSDNINQIH